MYKVAVKAIIFKQNKVLILCKSEEERSLKNSYGWDFPGGGLEVAEPLMDALTREVFEETRLTIRVIAPAFIYDEIHEDRHLIIAKFVCDQPVGEIMLSNEHETYDWLPLYDLEKRGLPEWMRKEVQRAYLIYTFFLADKSFNK